MATPRCRGSVYLAVLGASMLVLVIGVGALLALRIERKAAAGVSTATQARLLARSAIELTLLQINQNASWRTAYSNDAWSDPRSLGEGTYSFKLVDAVDSNLSNDATQPVWLYGKGMVGDAVRMMRVQLEPLSQQPGSNHLTNPDMEAGTANWTASDPANILHYTTAYAHSGAGSLIAYLKSGNQSGIAQDVLAAVQPGQTYRLSAWARMDPDNDDCQLVLVTTTTGGTKRTQGTSYHNVDSDRWYHITTTVTLAGDNLSAAQFIMRTEDDKGALIVDDVSLEPAGNTTTMAVEAGTWSQVVE